MEAICDLTELENQKILGGRGCVYWKLKARIREGVSGDPDSLTIPQNKWPPIGGLQTKSCNGNSIMDLEVLPADRSREKWKWFTVLSRSLPGALVLDQGQ